MAKIENATSVLLFGMTYMVIFGILIGITGQGSLDFSILEIITMMTVSAVVIIASAAIVAALANTEVLGTGARAGEFAWKAAVFSLVALWGSYFTLKMVGQMPAGVPLAVSALFLGPPIVAILWGFFATFLKSGGG